MAPLRRFRGLIFGLTLLAACQPSAPPPEPEPSPTPSPSPESVVPSGFDLIPFSFEDIPDWRETPIEASVAAFSKTCEVWSSRDPATPVSSRADYGGLIRDWLPACEILPRYIDAGELHRFFEDYFDIYIIETEEEINKLTGYYEPEIQASREPQGERSAPIPLRPDDLIEVRLGRFEDALDGRVVWGKVQGSELALYPERADIETAPDKAIGFATPADVFFLQIQGSGRVVFPDGSAVRASFSAHNHRPFGSLANHLLQTGEIERSEAGMTGVRAWIFRVGPDRAREAMNVNPRFVWFRQTVIENPEDGPQGAAGIPLTAMGSVAVDLEKHPLGVPVLVRAPIPQFPGDANAENSNLLLIAQDTGGAIKGAQRGDIYFGSGDEAGAMAGSMNQPGDFFVLLPQSIEMAQ